MSSRDHHSSSRKRDRSPDDRSRRSDRDRDHDKERHSSSSSSKRRESSPSRSSRHHSDQERGDKRESSSRSSRRSNKDKDRHREDRDTRKSSRAKDGREKDNDRSKDISLSSSRRRRDRSESGSESESSSGDSGSGSESEDDELVKKAKSLIQTISEDDYYTKSTEFRLWLRRSKKKYFEEMTADETRRYFKKFVKAWNNFDLDESYYKGIRSSQISNKGSTKYKWGFAKNIAKEDQNQVDSVRDSIDTMTNIRFANEVSRQTGVSTASSLGGSSSSTMGPPKRPGHSVPQAPGPKWPRTADEVADQEERDQRRRQQDRAAQKTYRKSKEADLEELVPKATGREAMLEKRRAQTAYNRRERSPDVELPEHALMGSGDDYKSMLAAERRRKEAREERKYGGRSFEPSLPSGPSGPSGPSPGGVGSVLEAKQAAYKEKEAKQLDAFRQLWAQSQAAKGL
ncbi:hypothetical protein BGZ59_000676 [Podila verticillata]|nr:hypothetical protein BGZ59_000676 [Podila verticillata]KFH70349.1 hypothetical protein MVEG_03200 [Podila verticillata NRRL 6337]